MKKSQLLIILTLLTVLVAINQFFAKASSLRRYLGGLPWYGWAGIGVFLIFAAVAFALRDAARARRLLEEPVEKHIKSARTCGVDVALKLRNVSSPE